MSERRASNWADYWAGMEHRRIFAAEATDHVERLRRTVVLSPDMQVLDFGCGFGHVAQLLAPMVGGVRYWDAAEVMRDATASRTAALANVSAIDLAGPPSETAPGTFDLILANSVVQYMDLDELGSWLDRWRAMLTPVGRIVLSDVPPPGGSVVTELVGMVRFAARHGFVVRAIRDGAAEAMRYARSRGTAQLLHLTPNDLTALAGDAGLVLTRLPANLTHRRGRLTVELAEPRSA